MSPEEFEENITYLKAAIITDGPKIVAQMAGDGKAIVELRVIREGIEGKMYSTKQIPTSGLKNKALNAGDRR